MTSSPFGSTRLTSGAASAIGPAGAALCGAGFDGTAAPDFCCGAAALAVRRPASEEAASVAASAKTKRLRLISVDFIRPSRIFTGGDVCAFDTDGGLERSLLAPVPTRFSFAALRPMIARRVATTRKAKVKRQKAKVKTQDRASLVNR